MVGGMEQRARITKVATKNKAKVKGSFGYRETDMESPLLSGEKN